ncbi:DEAD/DEAH box helicase family protein [Rhodobacter sp. HX-7-19]|uniref:DEAD/DEAH box helicase family protein n=1 Tax=Paragemmobacter kunshanensis TaxID=2583234 RepID=A0A6M1U260_9RHOB|nr:DEAD/DEAH box helicase family protein [Rhodobacter kunshanensis]NGQ92822.1 DEAD/DEAH box helicase family protein [Rhodobacter kunshanensis]
MTQFAFLRAEFKDLADPAQRAEASALSDPRGACFYARLALEVGLTWLYQREPLLKRPYETTLAALIAEPSLTALAGPAIVTKARFVKDTGNRAVHDMKPVTTASALAVLKELHHICYWIARTYAKGAKPDAGIAFDPAKLQKTLTISASTVDQIRKLKEDHDLAVKAAKQAEEARRATEEGRAAVEAELAALRAEIAAIRKANQAAPDTHDYNEAATRDAFIDLLLAEAGWPLTDARDREFEVHGMPNAEGRGFVDYVLWGDDGLPLAVVEAKRTRKDALVGQQQAKLYADCLEKAFGRRPVIFCTNGYEHWLWDDAMYPPRPVSGFYKKDELQLLHQRRASRKPLETVDVDEDIAGRFYQARAIRRVGEAFEKDRQRKALLVMATGSGKTRTVIALIDQLMRANWCKRVLFLADRVALVKQAHGAFKRHLPTAPSANLLEKHDPKKNDHSAARVCLSTYPTMMGLIDEVKDGTKRFSAGHFDLIVIDEAHRSVYRKYRAIFDYFDSLLVGLTATPRDEIDRDTYSLFQLERGVPTDAYDLDDAVADGYLVPPRVVSVPLKFQREGITYDQLSEEEKSEWDALEWNEDGEVPDRVDANDLNKWLFNEDTVDKVLEYLMTHGIKVAGGDRLGKTIIFAKNSKHAQFIVERFDANYPHHAGQFARLIDYSVVYAQSLIDDFSEAEKAPYIAVSVDMLDTGIDVPEVVNLVFFKIVRSKTKFWQMIGRGTRLRPDLFGVGQDKESFQIFDFCQNFEFFNQNPDRVEPTIGLPIGARLFNTRVELIAELAGKEDHADLTTTLRDRLYEEVAGMSVENFLVRQQRRTVERFQKRDVWDSLGIEDRLDLTTKVSGLPSAFQDDDLAAKQFDLLVLGAMLRLLQQDATFIQYSNRIRQVASDLEALANVPLVKNHLPLILEVQTDEFWQDTLAEDLERVRRSLRDLVKLIEPVERKIVYTDFTDEIGAGTEVTVEAIGTGIDKARFTTKVRRFLEKHRDHIALQKVRRAEQLTPMDLAELEKMFDAEGVPVSDGAQEIAQAGGLGLFLRSLVGLDRKAAKEAFSALTEGKTPTSAQKEFLDLLINHLTEQGVVDPARFYESPYTDLSDLGISGIFPEADIQRIIATVDDLRRKAVA